MTLSDDPGVAPSTAVRWCPSCRRAWPAATAACRLCFVELVDDLSATVRCRHCGKEWPASMRSCPNCLAELAPDPQRADDMLSLTLARGFYPARPAGSVPFDQGPACALLRARPLASLIFVGPDGFLEAHVDGHDHRAVPPLACRDLDGDLLFRLARYQAADDAVVAYGADGAPLGTFLRRPGLVHPVIDVRDETSAPVATLRTSRDWSGSGLDLVRTGGTVVARVGNVDVETDGWVDDEWSLRPIAGAGDLPLRPLAAVALLLAAKVLVGRAAPTHLEPRPRLSWDSSPDEE